MPERDNAFLYDLLEARIELFCAVGVDAEKWEEALDWACVGEDGLGDYVILTTAHKDKLLVEVIEFAERFETRVPHEVQVVHR